MMRKLIADFPEQVEAAWLNARDTQLSPAQRSISNVIVSGLGGSGIGGKIVAQLIQDTAAVPIQVVNDYLLPAYAGENTLVFISSYSGNTEETLSAMNQALTRGCMVACISSGGKVSELANEHHLNLISVPGGQPPRSQFGYSAISLMRLMSHYGLCGSALFNDAATLGAFLRTRQDASVQRAESLAQSIGAKQLIIYSEQGNEGVAIRWRQQVNENSKRLCWHHVYPEMNHNELVGWEGGHAGLFVLMLRSDDDHPRSTARMNITEEIMVKKGAHVENIIALGANRTERVFDLIHLGDWLSLALAEMDGIDPVSIVSIDYLKEALSQLP